MPAKREISLSCLACFSVADKIILNYAQLFIFLIVCLVTNADKHKNIFRHFPHSVHSYLYLDHIVRHSHFLSEFINVVLSIWIVPQVICLKHPLLVVSSLEPTNHRVWVSFFWYILVGPFIVLGLIYIKRSLFWGIFIVS